MKPISCILILLIGLGIASAGITTTAGDGLYSLKRINFSPDRPAVSGEILVKFKSGTFKGEPIQVNGTVRTSQVSVNEILTQLQVKVMRQVFRSARAPLGDIYRLRFEAPVPLFEALKRMASDPNVEWVEPNYLSFTFETTPNDPYFPQQWGLAQIQADQAWDISRGDPSITIAVIDTGVDYDHPDLAANIWNNPGEVPGNEVDDDGNGYVDDDMGWDFVSVTEGGVPGEDMGPPDRDPMDFQGHGTGCAGIVSAVTHNNTGIAGTTWNCKIMVLRAGYKNAEGKGTLADSDSAAALHYAADNGAHVISMSWGGDGSGTLSSAINYAYDAGCILVAAAGNDGADSKQYPAAYSGVIAVAASDQNDNRASFSNYGSWVDIAAPGANIHSTAFDDNYAPWNGTSMATPFVTGAAGLMLSQNPTLAADTVIQRLLDSADDVEWLVGGVVVEPTKRLNVYQALRLHNDPPVVSGIPDVSFNEDESDSSIDLDNYVDDPDNTDAEITWTYTGNANVNVSINSTSHAVIFTALLNWNGSETITFTATDLGDLSSSDAMIVIVNAVNDPPIASNLTIEPLPPGPADDLRALYTYNDVDGGTEISAQIKWYKNGAHQPYDDILTLPSSVTSPGEGWYFTLTPSDGIDVGETKISPSVIIGGLVQELHLYPGWNLISIYVGISNTELSSVLAPIEGLYTSVWAYDAASENWTRYIPGVPVNDLGTMEHGKGYWINIAGDEEVILPLVGEPITDTDVVLHPGRNIVGYNSSRTQAREDALSSIEYISIWTYDSARAIWLRYVVGSLNPPDTIIANLEPGNGYVIYVEGGPTWIVSP